MLVSFIANHPNLGARIDRLPYGNATSIIPHKTAQCCLFVCRKSSEHTKKVR